MLLVALSSDFFRSKKMYSFLRKKIEILRNKTQLNFIPYLESFVSVIS